MSRAVLLLPLLWMLACGGERAVPVIADAGSDRLKPALPLPDPDSEDSAAWAPPRWQCGTKPDGRHFCRRDWPDAGLPPLGSGWLCHLARHLGAPRWICHGSAASIPATTSPWSCVRVDGQTVRCEKLDAVNADRPPDPGTWVCVKGKVYGGTLCERVSDPNPPDLAGGPCVPGQRLWCDGRVYDAWGHVECDPTTRRWKTITVGGKAMLDCDEALSGGNLPLTRCALHHFFFSPLCCERTDCIVPDGTAGQPFAKSPGGFCDFCNPMKPECTEPGAKCIVTQSLETFCGRLCSDATPCPVGSECVDVTYKQGGTKQCVPQDLSCYF